MLLSVQQKSNHNPEAPPPTLLLREPFFCHFGFSFLKNAPSMSPEQPARQNRKSRAGVLILILVIGIAIALVAIQTNFLGRAKSHNPQQPQTSRQSTLENVSAQQFYQLVQKNQCIVLDVRTAQEYQQGHIPGAKNIDFYSDSFRQVLSRLPRDTAYCVYCRSGRRSTITAQQMARMGFHQIYNLQGGILQWQRHRYPLQKGSSTR